MNFFDWAALVFSMIVVALQMVAELKDINLCLLAIEHAGDTLSAGWQLALFTLGAFRRWAVLPALLNSIPMLITVKGGDALNVCFNTVAVL